MTLSFIGHGYVGLVTAAVFADLGNKVWVIGHTKDKINALTKGILPIYEPGLEEMVKRNIAAGRIIFTLDYDKAIPESMVVFICVGTPPNKDGSADLSTVFSVSQTIGKHLNDYTVIVVKSTVPPGTNKKVYHIIKNTAKNIPFDTASAPEFLREGSAISDTLTPDRIVLGTNSERARKTLNELHQSIHGPIVATTIETAEMIKYVANSILSTKISFANAVSFLCDSVGADVEDVMDGVGLDKRIGRSFLSAGVGYGGSCFPKDVKALIAFAKEHGYDFKLLKAVDEINKQAIDSVVSKIERLLAGQSPSHEGTTVGVLGLAFKPNTDDMRAAPSLEIIKRLKAKGIKIRAYDPVAMKNAQKLMPDIRYVRNAYEAAEDTDLLLVVTEWNEFKQLDLKKIKKRMKHPALVDGRNIYDPKQMKSLGFSYIGIGRS